MKKFLLSFAFFPLFFLISSTNVYADIRVQATSYEPISCGSDCTTLRVYYNQTPPEGGWGLANWGGLNWSGSAGPTNIHNTYADYTWSYPYNQGLDRVVLGSGDNFSSPFTLDFSVTQLTTIPMYDSVAVTGYEFLPGGNSISATVRIYYSKVPPEGGWGLVNWQNHTMWSGAAGPTNIHDTYADYTFGYPYVPTGVNQYVIASADDFSSVFAIDWSALSVNTVPSIQSLMNATINNGDIYSTNGSFTDPDSTSWTATVNYGDGGGSEPLQLNPDKTFTLSHQFNTAAEYTVIVTVTDNQGASDDDTAIVTVVIPEPITTTFDSSADTYIKSGSDNRNTGAGTFMRLQSSGDNRSLVKFDQTAMQTEIGNNQVLSAKLRVTITDNGNNWGTTGRTIDVHRLISNWSEGDGTENDRGTGAGATWNCAIDSLIENQAQNCTGTTAWEMGQPNNPAVHPWVQTASATQTITNNQLGVVEFDVTSDVASFLNSTNQNYGWIIKKTAEGQNGQVSFGTKESASAPQLVVTYQP